MANVLVCDSDAASATATAARAPRVALAPDHAERDQRQRHQEQRLPERVGEVAGGLHRGVQRHQVEDARGHRAGDTVARGSDSIIR